MRGDGKRGWIGGQGRRLAPNCTSGSSKLLSTYGGEKGCPQWGTKFTQIEGECCEVADELARELTGQGLDEQAEAIEAVPASTLLARRRV